MWTRWISGHAARPDGNDTGITVDVHNDYDIRHVLYEWYKTNLGKEVYEMTF